MDVIETPQKQGSKSLTLCQFYNTKMTPQVQNWGQKWGLEKFFLFCENLDTVYLFVYYFG